MRVPNLGFLVVITRVEYIWLTNISIYNSQKKVCECVCISVCIYTHKRE